MRRLPKHQLPSLKAPPPQQQQQQPHKQKKFSSSNLRNLILIVISFGCLMIQLKDPAAFYDDLSLLLTSTSTLSATEDKSEFDAAVAGQQQQLRSPVSRKTTTITSATPPLVVAPLTTQQHQNSKNEVESFEVLQEQLSSSILKFPHFIQEYIQFHRSMKNAPQAKYLIWRCPRGSTCGGTGDRLKGIMTAFYTAICTRRVLLIDWPLKESTTVAPFLAPHYIDWRVPDQLSIFLAAPNIPKYDAMDIYDNVWFKQLQIPTSLEHHLLIDMRCNLWSEHIKAVVRVNDTQCLQNFWTKEDEKEERKERQQQTTSSFQPPPHYAQDRYLFRIGFWTMFTFGNAVHNRKRSIQLDAKLLEYSSSASSSSNNDNNNNDQSSKQQSGALVVVAPSPPRGVGQTEIRPYIGVHIRTGIGSGWHDPERHNSQNDYDQFYRCAKRLQRGIFEKQRQHRQQSCGQQPPNDSNNKVSLVSYDYQKALPLLPIFVAADNKIGKQAMIELDRNEVNTNTTVRVLADMEIFHIDRSHSLRMGNHAENSVWGELNVLLESTCLVASRSGFSDLATWLQPTPTGRRCSVMFNQCDDETIVQRALDALDFSSSGSNGLGC